MHPVEIYTRPGCGYCEHALALLTSRHIPFIEYDVYQDSSALQVLRTRTANRTYPQVFINNRSVGGFEELLNINFNNLK
ncbi:glutaredoxin [Paraglaciecola sp. 25GB23A]|uniref:glutaredoxin family protein n=1 Tax=Paraglaciecola sp. 25GB23A TaxID=3156068 RepID=UPI0032AF2BD1